ncbi:hypothetical protein [Thermomonospora umbrina]|uniref:Uncharacterized protein n=1 Tax=Thermomonospora umbrina TaxID=111806 RepID=A0A3D9SRE7_9ACTN|nr:hypothetical protein [Thermomonospora umbrina]REE97080.1 hypothetical protein DFJ69_2536 [Thermomonospora umbrina]
MIFLGLIITAVAVTCGAVVISENNDTARLTAFGENIPGVTAEWHAFLAGSLVATVFMAGLTVLLLGVSRSVRTRRELRYLREEHEESITTLEMEKRQLQRELARIRRETGPQPAMTGPTPPHQTVAH